MKKYKITKAARDKIEAVVTAAKNLQWLVSESKAVGSYEKFEERLTKAKDDLAKYISRIQNPRMRRKTTIRP